MKFATLTKLFLWTSIFAISHACNEQQPTENSDLDILGGTRPTASNPGSYSAVSLFSNSKRYAFCTGTVVANNLIVTAAHCLKKYPAFDISIVFAEQKNDLRGGNSRQATDRQYHMQFNGSPNGGYDIGWVKFSGGLPNGYRPMPILSNPSYMRPQTPVTLVGFGNIGEVIEGQGYKLSVDVMIREYSTSGSRAGILYVGGYRNKGACYGDSGGPAYVKFANRWFLVGATSGRDMVTVPTSMSRNCEDGYAAYSHVGFHLSWIEQTSGVRLSSYQRPEDAPAIGVTPDPTPGPVNPDPFPEPTDPDPFPDPTDPFPDPTIDPNPFPNPNPNPNPNPVVIPPSKYSLKISNNTLYFKNVTSNVTEISLHVLGNATILQKIKLTNPRKDFTEPLRFDIRAKANGKKLGIRAVFIAKYDVAGIADFTYDPAKPNPPVYTTPTFE